MAHPLLAFIFAPAADDSREEARHRLDASRRLVNAVPRTTHDITSEAGFAALYREFFQPLWAFAYRYVRNEALAEEIVQDVFTWLWSARQTLHIETTLRAYLFSAVRNRALTTSTRNATRQRVHSADHSNSPANSPQQDIESTELEHAVRTAVAALPERQRLAMTLRLTHGMTYAEISSVLHISEAAVGKLILKAQERLRQALWNYRLSGGPTGGG